MKFANVLKVAGAAAIVFAAGAQAADESFEASINLIKPVTVTEVASLRFPEQIAGTARSVVVQPDNSGAAQFNSAGEPLRNVTASIVESSITMTTGTGDTTAKQIPVSSFEFGGTVAPDGSGQFDATGTLNNIRVGATATIDAEDESGAYVGTATFRLVYA